jgi:DNA-binding response OmpR family regulator
VLRRTSKTPAARRLEFEDIVIDGIARSVSVREAAVSLTSREFDLLYHLARHPSQVFSREQLLATVWDHDYEGDTGTVTVHIRRLREKVERDPSRPRHVRTVWGSGYRFEP